jgi:pectate lyase
VTNLNDSGAGSLRAAVHTPGPRHVVFNIGGDINLVTTVGRNCPPFMTIAGETAPGQGISIKGHQVRFGGTHDIIMRHIAMRSTGAAGKDVDAFGIVGGERIILDHCTMQYGQDESCMLWSNYDYPYGIRAVTIQNSLISESMSGKNNINAGAQATYWRNLHAFSGDRLMGRITGQCALEYLNCVGYNTNWGPCGTGNGIIDFPAPVLLSYRRNRIIQGPNGPVSGRPICAITSPDMPWIVGSALYMEGNIAVGSGIGQHNWPAQYVVTTPPVDSGVTNMIAADQALEDWVLAHAGSRPIARDAMAQRTIDRVRARAGGNMSGSSWASYGGYIPLPVVTAPYVPPSNPNGVNPATGYTYIEEDFHRLSALLDAGS